MDWKRNWSMEWAGGTSRVDGWGTPGATWLEILPKCWSMTRCSQTRTGRADFAVTGGSAPTAATGLKVWFKAGAGLLQAGSGQASQWLDQSGNGNHASQSSSGAQPLYVPNAINGEPAVRFDGVNDYLSF